MTKGTNRKRLLPASGAGPRAASAVLRALRRDTSSSFARNSGALFRRHERLIRALASSQVFGGPPLEPARLAHWLRSVREHHYAPFHGRNGPTWRQSRAPHLDRYLAEVGGLCESSGLNADWAVAAVVSSHLSMALFGVQHYAASFGSWVPTQRGTIRVGSGTACARGEYEVAVDSPLPTEAVVATLGAKLGRRLTEAERGEVRAQLDAERIELRGRAVASGEWVSSGNRDLDAHARWLASKLAEPEMTYVAIAREEQLDGIRDPHPDQVGRAIRNLADEAGLSLN